MNKQNKAIPVRWHAGDQRFYPDDQSPDFVLVPVSDWSGARVRHKNDAFDPAQEKPRIGF